MRSNVWDVSQQSEAEESLNSGRFSLVGEDREVCERNISKMEEEDWDLRSYWGEIQQSNESEQKQRQDAGII